MTNDHRPLTIDSDIIGYLKEHENKDMLRFLTCGSVDDAVSYTHLTLPTICSV